ncbi:hypothetical protein GE253_00800 [Niveispirillum sp. SYP-B3756]|uniref:hypothetical protein n=1 Tax=Niveispirillum sp. SYP-B3756 TaxID=2662178 RepID=UPI0012918E8D|nr:hypothetical protein [Niveispirillum sp. SYP-B3756]MQP63873.1 hypothetical protein [Niveispirillum sp. SYP-B3756]
MRWRLRDRATFQHKAGIVTLWVVVLGAAWSLPVLSAMQHQAEKARMESGYYYTPQRPASAYLEALAGE